MSWDRRTEAQVEQLSSPTTPEQEAAVRDLLIEHGLWSTEVPEMLGLIR